MVRERWQWETDKTCEKTLECWSLVNLRFDKQKSFTEDGNESSLSFSFPIFFLSFASVRLCVNMCNGVQMKSSQWGISQTPQEVLRDHYNIPPPLFLGIITEFQSCKSRKPLFLLNAGVADPSTLIQIRRQAGVTLPANGKTGLKNIFKCVELHPLHITTFAPKNTV